MGIPVLGQAHDKAINTESWWVILTTVSVNAGTTLDDGRAD